MSQVITYANPEAQRPGLGSLSSSATERENTTKNRYWATVPFWISYVVHLFFLLQYWLPETAGFPKSRWWMDQLAPLASTWLTSRGEPQVPIQASSGLAPLVMLVAGIGLVYLSRTHQWWRRVAFLVTVGVGMLAGLGILVRLLSTGGNRTSTLSVMLLVLWLIAAGITGSQGWQDRMGSPPPKTWRSGLPMLVGHALFFPVPVAAGRWFFGSELRDAAFELRGNTVALRQAGLWTASSLWLYLSGLLICVTIWVLYRWWPLRPGTQVTGLLIALAVMLIILGGVGWQAGALAGLRATQLTRFSPEGESFTCAAWASKPPNLDQPARTLTISGGGCQTVTAFAGYRQVVTRKAGISLSPVEARTPEDQPIAGREVGARYDDIVVLAATDRVDRTPTRLVGLRLSDTVQVWQVECAEDLRVRFALVAAGDNPGQGHITDDETEPTVVVGCAGKVTALDPLTGRGT